MQVVVNGYLTSYEQTGKGPLVLFIHGWADSSKSWIPIINHLPKGYEVVAPDLPGFGGTQAPKEAWGLDEYANFIHAFLNKIEKKSVYVTVGHSNGGAIAIRGISKDILSSDKLILLASAGIRGTDKGRVAAIKWVTKTGKVITKPLSTNMKNKLRHKLYKTVKSDMLVAEDVQETFKKVVSDDVSKDAERITIPTLLVYGENDAQVPLRYGEQFHELIDGSTLEILPNAGHFVQIDRPQEVIKAIGDFLK